MNFREVDIDFLEYNSISKNIESVSYNGKKSLEIFTPLVFIKKIKDKYNNEFIQIILDDYLMFKDLLGYIDLHAMICHNISQDDKENFKSSLFENVLSCKVLKNKGQIVTNFTINQNPASIYNIKNNDKAKCLIYIDTIWKEDNTISLKWKIKKCCVYRNETKYN